MPGRNRRSIIAGSATLLTGSLLVANAAVADDVTSEERDETDVTVGNNLEFDVTADDGGHISIHSPADAEEDMVVREMHENRETATRMFNVDVMNYRYESVNGELTFEVDNVVNR